MDKETYVQVWSCTIQTPEGRTQVHLVPYSTSQMDAIDVSKGMVWWFMGGREKKWFRLYGQRQREERKEVD